MFLHRHPSHSVASGAGLVEAVNASVNLKLDEKKQRKMWAQFLMTTYSGMANSAVLFRSEFDTLNGLEDYANNANNESLNAKFLDIYYDDLIDDPIGTANLIYKFSNECLSDGVKVEMEKFLSMSNNARMTSERKPKKYTLEDFGLDLEDINQNFKPYLDRFFPHQKNPSRGNQPPESSYCNE